MEAENNDSTVQDEPRGMEVESEEGASGSPQKSQDQARKQRNITTSLGRPGKTHREPIIQYAMREHTIPVYNKWSEHKRVLIGLELQFCYERESKVVEEKKSKSKRNECGFLSWKGNPQKHGTVVDPAKYYEYETLSKLLKMERRAECPQAEKAERDLADMVELALSIKHEAIEKEWRPIYELICDRVLSWRGQGQKFVDATFRKEWQQRIRNELLELVQSMPEQCELMKRLLKESKIDLGNLLKKEAYCFLAEYFNFRINEYFPDAFEPPITTPTPPLKDLELGKSMKPAISM